MGFRANVIARILLIVGSALLAPVFVFGPQSAILSVGLVLFSLLQLMMLIRYVERTNRDLSRFLMAIRYDDFTASFPDAGLGRSFKDLSQTFSLMQHKFRKTRAQAEEQYQYLQTIVQHVRIGLLVLRENGDVDLINNAAKRMFQMASLRQLESLKAFSEQLVVALENIEPGRDRLVKMDDRDMALALSATELRMGGNRLKVVSLQNIRGELEESELNAWQNLIRVLTHEIMNSMTPISSLAGTILDMIRHEEVKQKGDAPRGWDQEEVEEICQAISTIQKRSQSLMNLIHAYRNMALIPKPEFAVFPVRDLFDKVISLLDTSVEGSGVTLAVDVQPASLELTADPNLVEQVLINLMLNAIDATKETSTPKISLRSSHDAQGRVTIEVMDNGHGISESTCQKVFTPFFTTKKTGSGIGLSFSKQIMRLHKGSISVDSNPNKKTTFTLRF